MLCIYNDSVDSPTVEPGDVLAVARLMSQAVAEVAGCDDTSTQPSGLVQSGGLPQEAPAGSPSNDATHPLTASAKREGEVRIRFIL